ADPAGQHRTARRLGSLPGQPPAVAARQGLTRAPARLPARRSDRTSVRRRRRRDDQREDRRRLVPAPCPRLLQPPARNWFPSNKGGYPLSECSRTSATSRAVAATATSLKRSGIPRSSN